MAENLIIGGQRPTLPDGVFFWPDSLPLAQLNSLSSTVRDGRIISKMDQGPPKIRRGYVNQPIDFSGRFKMTAEQRQEYERFYRDDLLNGLLLVAMPVKDSRGLAYSFSKIISWSEWAQISPSRWSITLSFVEVGRP